MKTGQQVYEEFIAKVRQQDSLFICISIKDYHYSKISVILPENHDEIEQHMIYTDAMSWAYSIEEGTDTINYTDTDKPEYFKTENFKGDTFQGIFPGYRILSAVIHDEDASFEELENQFPEGECFLIDTTKESYPVIFFYEGVVVYVTDDLETFVENHIIF